MEASKSPCFRGGRNEVEVEVCWLVLMGQQLKVPLGPQVSHSHPERCTPGQWSRAEQEIDADLTPQLRSASPAPN